MLKFLAKNLHNTAAIEKLTKQDRDTNANFEFKSEKIATRGRSFPSVLVCVLSPTMPSHVEKGPPTEPIEENDRKQALALERRQDTKSLGCDIVQEALRAVGDLLLDDSLSHQKESTNK